jgi:hypothetical protein
MLLPVLATAMAAGPFYFAGIVLTQRQARWFGTRLLPLGMAIACAAAVFLAPQFWQTAIITLAGTAIGALAGWHVFSTAGACDRPGAPNFALGAMIYMGALGIGFLLVAMVTIFQSRAIWRDLRVDRDGNVLRIRWTLESGRRTCVVTDVNDRPLPEYDSIDIDDSTGEMSDRFAHFSGSVIDEERVVLPTILQGEIYGYRTPTPGLIGLRAISTPGIQLRRTYLYDGIKRIIGVYDPVTKSFLGTIGPNGYLPRETPQDECFPEMLLNRMTQSNSHTLCFPAVVYWMELDQQRVRRIFAARLNDPVVAAINLPPQSDPTVAVVTCKNVLLMRPSGDVIFDAAHHLDLSKYWINFAMLQTPRRLLLQAIPFDWIADAPPYRLLEFGSTGTLIRETTAPPMDKVVSPTMLRRTALMGGVYPLAALPLFSSWTMDEIFELDTVGHAAMFGGFLIGSALLSAVVTLLIARRLGFTSAKTATWFVANALLGPAGVVTLLGLNAWMAREVCSACHRLRLVARRECSRCGAPLQLPARDGREIFDPTDTIAGTIREFHATENY